MLYRFLSPEVPGFWPSNAFVEISLIAEDMLVESECLQTQQKAF